MTAEPTPNDLAALQHAEDAWRAEDWPAVIHHLQHLGLNPSPDDLDAIHKALKAANGRRQDHRVEPRDLLTKLAIVRSGQLDALQYPAEDRMGWLKRDTTRAIIRLNRDRDARTLTLQIGTQAISSYLHPSNTKLLLTRAIPEHDPAPQAHAEPTPATPLPIDLPIDLHERLHNHLFGHRSASTFSNVADVLNALQADPHYPHAVRFVEASLDCWPDDLRAIGLHMARGLLETPHAHLLRHLFVLGNALREHLRQRPADAPPLHALRALRFIDLPELTDATPDDDLLAFFPNLEHLHIERATDPDRFTLWLTQQTLPDTLHTLTANTLPRPHALERFPDLRDLHLSAFALPYDPNDLPLNLPDTLRLHLHQIHNSDLLKRAERALPQRPLHQLKIYIPSHATQPLLNDLAASPLLPRLEALEAYLPKDGTASLLRDPQALHLTSLHLTIEGSIDSRFAGKKPADVAYSAADLDALCALPLDRLSSLTLSGTLTPELAAQLARALAAAKAPLQHLTLHATHLGNKGLQAFAQAGLLRDLHTLGLHDAKTQGDGLALAFHPDHAPQHLHTLILSKNSIPQRAVDLLALWPLLANINHLDLQNTRITPKAKDTLLASTYLRRGAVQL